MSCCVVDSEWMHDDGDDGGFVHKKDKSKKHTDFNTSFIMQSNFQLQSF